MKQTIQRLGIPHLWKPRQDGSCPPLASAWIPVLTAGHWAHGNLFWGNLEATMKPHEYVSPEDCFRMFYDCVTHIMILYIYMYIGLNLFVRSQGMWFAPLRCGWEPRLSDHYHHQAFRWWPETQISGECVGWSNPQSCWCSPPAEF